MTDTEFVLVPAGVGDDMCLRVAINLEVKMLVGVGDD